LKYLGGDLKRLYLTLGIGLLLVSQAYAQYSGQLSTASTTAEGMSKTGVYAGIYDGAIGILGQYRYGVGAYTDIGFKVGLLSLNQGLNNNVGSDAGLNLAFDFKYRVMERRLRDPFDLSIGGVAEILAVNGFDMFSFGPSAVGSYPIQLHDNRTLEPYGRLILQLRQVSPDRRNDNPDFAILLNMGTAFELSKSIRAFTELQFNDPFAFFLGVDFDL
jgi:hypothetical protein